MAQSTGLTDPGLPGAKQWRPEYWGYSLAIALFLYAFNAAQIVSFEEVRAPNVSVFGQLFLMFVFYTLWVFVPRIAWWVLETAPPERATLLDHPVTRLIAVGTVLSIVHLSLLTLFLLIMHAPPGWGLYRLAKGTGEVWLGNSGLWLIVFGLTCLGLNFIRNRPDASQAPHNLEVRQNGRIVTLRPKDIVWIEASGNYVEIHVEKATYTLRRSMADLEAALKPAGFFRSHRRALINLAQVDAIRTGGDDGQYAVEMTGAQSAPLSRRKLGLLRAALKGLASTG